VASALRVSEIDARGFECKPNRPVVARQSPTDLGARFSAVVALDRLGYLVCRHGTGSLDAFAVENVCDRPSIDTE
jgi:hypothetical protein